jgi:hypothetical protein
MDFPELAAIHWPHLARYLVAPTNDAECDALVAALDELQKVTGYDNDHPLDSLVNVMAVLICDYDDRHRPFTEAFDQLEKALDANPLKDNQRLQELMTRLPRWS